MPLLNCTLFFPRSAGCHVERSGDQGGDSVAAWCPLQLTGMLAPLAILQCGGFTVLAWLQAREVLATPIEAVTESLAARAVPRDEGPHRHMLERMFGQYTFDDPQLEVRVPRH